MLYGADLLGAAAGCLAIVWLLERTDITSTAFGDRRGRGGRRAAVSRATPDGAAARLPSLAVVLLVRRRVVNATC